MPDHDNGKEYNPNLCFITFLEGMENRRFLLKCAAHLINMDAFLNAYSDADLIFIQRPLRETIPSVLSQIQASLYAICLSKIKLVF